MLKEINERLMRAKERVRAARKLEAMLRQTRKFLDGEEKTHTVLRGRLLSEKADVDKLEGLSVTGLFYGVLGEKAARLEKEKREYLAAKLKYDENVRAIEQAKLEIKRLRAELDALGAVDAEYNQLINEKLKMMAAANYGPAGQLFALSERLADLHSDHKELREAVQAGEAALEALRSVSVDLNRAATLGTWDMLGGGTFTTMAKHSRIDSAKAKAHQAQGFLRRFQEELADAGERLQVSLQIGEFSKFADYFFDGLIADWAVQKKINNAVRSCNVAMTQVADAVNICRRKMAETEKRIRDIDQTRKELIEQVS
ncbi:MAG: hypothetical protein R2747_09330 [Pyrinomonadaceae bacterium]